MNKTLIIILGPTGVGKTNLSLNIAKKYKTEIISCDSRQIFKELPIGTAAPSKEELNTVKHHLIASHSIFDYYSCGKFELDALNIIENIFKENDIAVMVGGSMLYIDAICKGIDEIPDVDQELRNSLNQRYATEGIDNMRAELKMLDPEFYEKIDKKNHKRIIHALEVCLNSGKPYSQIRKESEKKRPFNIIKVGLNIPREELYNRINLRVDKMMEEGLLEEAKNLYLHKELNSLNTVGYKELFNFFDGTWSLEYAINMIKQDTRHYAKKQLSWFNRDIDITWFEPTQIEEIYEYLDSKIIINKERSRN